MMPISELPMGIFDQTKAYAERPPAPEAATHLSKLEQKRKSTQAAVAARKLSGIMMDKWSTVQGKIFFCRHRRQTTSYTILYDQRQHQAAHVVDV